MKTSILCFFLLVINAFLITPISVRAQDNISWLDNYTSDITVGTNTFGYTFKTIDNNPCKISVEEKKTDKKGVTVTMTYQFYLSNLNLSTLNFKTSGSVALVNLSIKQNQKFIKIIKNGEMQGYDSDFTITISEIEKARSFIDLIKSNAEKCKSIELSWTSRDETMEWLSQNISKSSASGTIYDQSFKQGEKSYLINFESGTTNSKGVVQNLSYNFNLNDINPSKISMEISGKIFKIVLPVLDNNYYIRMKKGSDEFSFVKEMEIFSDDLEQARNILNAMIFLVNNTPAPKYNSPTDYFSAMNFIKVNITNFKNGSSTLEQSFTSDDSPSGISKISMKKNDSKKQGIQTDESFYLIDLQPTVTIEASAKGITLNLNAKDKLKYIRESIGNTILSFSSSVEIAQIDLDKARELKQAIEFAIGKSEKGIIEFGKIDQTTEWLLSNVNEVKYDGETVSQTFSINSSNENEIELKCTAAGNNGKSVTWKYLIYPEDLKIDNCQIKFNGKRLFVALSTGKSKYIKCLKENVLQNFDSDIDVAFNDVLKAKNFIGAITLLKNKSQVSDRSFESKNSAFSYISDHVKKNESSGSALDQRMEQRENDPCKGKFTTNETNSKGASTENSFEFTLSDIDPAASSVNVSSKNLTVNLVTKKKEKLIKPFKNGVAGNFVSDIDIQVDDVLTAKKMIAAFSSLINFCR
jgi:hypothetical protein